jgi:hypothetical protein
MDNIMSFAHYVCEGNSEVFNKQYKRVQQAVDAAIKLLTGDSQLGGGKFLVEIAMVESKLGTDDNTIRNAGTQGKGVWQIDKLAFDSTKDVKSHPILSVYHKRLLGKGVDWSKVSWNDCNQLLYGAIAARLYLLVKPFKIAETMDGRAAQWKKYYNTGSGKGTVDVYKKHVKHCVTNIGNDSVIKMFLD